MAAKADKTLYLDTTQPETRNYKAKRALEEGKYTIDLTHYRWRVGGGQRGYYWGYVVVEVGKLIDKGREQTDRILTALFLSEPCTVAGSTITVVRSLSDLDPNAAMDYFEQIAGWAYTTYGFRLAGPDPAKRKRADRSSLNNKKPAL